MLLRRASRGVVHRMLERVCCSICIYFMHVFVECPVRIAAVSHARSMCRQGFFSPSTTSVETRERIFTSCFAPPCCFNCITFFSLYIGREQLCKYCICVKAFFNCFCWRGEKMGEGCFLCVCVVCFPALIFFSPVAVSSPNLCCLFLPMLNTEILVHALYNFFLCCIGTDSTAL